jgi:hypothetical protein
MEHVGIMVDDLAVATAFFVELGLKRSRGSWQMRDAVDLDSFPSPACSHSDSTSRIDSPRTNAPITIALSGSVRSSFVPRGNSLETNGCPRCRA